MTVIRAKKLSSDALVRTSQAHNARWSRVNTTIQMIK